MSELVDQLRIAATFLELGEQRNNDAETMRKAAAELEKLAAEVAVLEQELEDAADKYSYCSCCNG